MNKERTICKRCVLDDGIPNIRFDENGICNYCKLFDELTARFPNDSRGDNIVAGMIERIRKNGKGKEYDCVVGISGGVDSTYLLYKILQFGLRPLAVHFDNGWDSELAVNNINNLLKKNNVELFTYVVDWEEFKNLQLAFFEASVPDIEMLTDHAIIAVLYKTAVKYKLKYILVGNNFRTEGVIPRGWTYWDNKYFYDIVNKFSKVRVKSYPILSSFKKFYYKRIKKIEFISLLNYMNYQKSDVINLLEEKMDWRNYGGKHYESIFTRWFQSHYLPQKFNIDKRKVHLSALICSGQKSREDALNELRNEPYPLEAIEKDTIYIKKKLELSDHRYEELWSKKPLTFRNYSTYYPLKRAINNILQLIGINVQKRP